MTISNVARVICRSRQNARLLVWLFASIGNAHADGKIHSDGALGVGLQSAQAVTPSPNMLFSPADGVQVNLHMDGPKVKWSLRGQDVTSNDEVIFDTEKKLRLTVADYNFDGYKDFSVSHLDDGMGTYQLFFVYVYSAKQKTFTALTPRCGDEFINLKRVSKRHALFHSYIEHGHYQVCETVF